MHFKDGTVPAEYNRYVGRKMFFVFLCLLALGVTLVISVSLGAVRILPLEVLKTFFAFGEKSRNAIIIWNIRLPQALTAIVSGAALSVSGAVMQSILRNPLGSPFTLGISHAAAFGAALSVMLLGAGQMGSSGADAVVISSPYMTTFSAFLFCLVATGVIMGIARIRGTSPEVMILAGVALGALFTAGTMFLQYFADDVQLAAMVFWTFGDVARADWGELAIMTAITGVSSIYFIVNRWNYNAIDAGDETAKSLGVRVKKVRLVGMLVASLITAVVISFLGVIGFVGLVCPHIVRRIIGDDHRFLLPASILVGGLLLLISDTTARLILAPNVLPVSILTAFMGAPVFIYLLVKGYKR
ncbi:MAG: FecCD family ABC transporter permease [Thermodesulfobacteriota bacterium]